MNEDDHGYNIEKFLMGYKSITNISNHEMRGILLMITEELKNTIDKQEE